MLMMDGSGLRRAGVMLPAAVAVAGACVAAAGAWWLQADANAEAEAEFRRSVVRVSADITDRFRKPVYGLNGARGVYATHGTVRRETFRAYTASRDLQVDFPGVRGFGFIQRVPREALAPFVAAERADGAPQFAVRQLTEFDQPDLFVIKFIEPAGAQPGCARPGRRLRSRAPRSRAAGAADRRAHPHRHRDPRAGPAPGPWRAAGRAGLPAGAGGRGRRRRQVHGAAAAACCTRRSSSPNCWKGLGDVTAGQVRVRALRHRQRHGARGR